VLGREAPSQIAYPGLTKQLVYWPGSFWHEPEKSIDTFYLFLQQHTFQFFRQNFHRNHCFLGCQTV
jgi:hypothetical protein